MFFTKSRVLAVIPAAGLGHTVVLSQSSLPRTLNTRDVQPIAVPPVDTDIVRETREALNMSRHVFVFKLGVNPRTLERWEQGRSKPSEQAAALFRLVRKYPDTLERLESLAASA
jgi:putative transcriptional regulator